MWPGKIYTAMVNFYVTQQNNDILVYSFYASLFVKVNGGAKIWSGGKYFQANLDSIEGEYVVYLHLK